MCKVQRLGGGHTFVFVRWSFATCVERTTNPSGVTRPPGHQARRPPSQTCFLFLKHFRFGVGMNSFEYQDKKLSKVAIPPSLEPFSDLQLNFNMNANAIQKTNLKQEALQGSCNGSYNGSEKIPTGSYKASYRLPSGFLQIRGPAMSHTSITPTC